MRSHLAALLALFTIAILDQASLRVAAEEEGDEEWDVEWDDDYDEDDAELILPHCEDSDDMCSKWAAQGECEANAKWMLKNCKRSCKNCLGENPFAVQQKEKKYKGEDMGTPQQLSFADGTREQDIQWLLNKAKNYMVNIVEDAFDQELADMCTNKHEHCAWWALLGECEMNPTYMLKKCGPVCTSCDYLTVQGRCPLDPDAIDAWQPGDLHKLFKKLTSEPYKSKYDVNILSSPKTTGGPWVITMENVVSPEEAVRLIELGYEMGFERSTDVGKMRADGSFEKNVNDGRTSTNAWCEDHCFEDEFAQAVQDRISELTGIPETNSEHMQILRYETGQYYNTHHDYIPHHIDKQGGVRILTFFLYLNDVIEGGETSFDKLNITVTPRRGRAVVWPSVKNKKPNRKDKRTTHQALPVLEGIKYGANAWIHQRDFKTAHENGCMGG